MINGKTKNDQITVVHNAWNNRKNGLSWNNHTCWLFFSLNVSNMILICVTQVWNCVMTKKDKYNSCFESKLSWPKIRTKTGICYFSLVHIIGILGRIITQFCWVSRLIITEHEIAWLNMRNERNIFNFLGFQSKNKQDVELNLGQSQFPFYLSIFFGGGIVIARKWIGNKTSEIQHFNRFFFSKSLLLRWKGKKRKSGSLYGDFSIFFFFFFH